MTAGDQTARARRSARRQGSDAKRIRVLDAELAQLHAEIAALHARESRVEALLARSSDVLLEMRNGTITFISSNAKDIIGDRPVIGMAPFDLIHPDDQPLLQQAYVGGVQGDIDFTFRLKVADGSWEWREARGTREIVDGEGRSTLLLRDVTERREMEIALRDSATRIDALMQHSFDVLVELRQGLVHYISPNVAEIMGFSAAEVTGKPATEFVHPDDVTGLVDWFGAETSFTGELGYEARLKHAVDGWHWFETTGAHRRASTGDLHTVLLMRDVTARREAEDALRESEALFRALSESAPVGIFQTDTAGRCLYTNRRWQQITGLDARSAIGEGWARAIHADDAESVLQEWGAAVAEGRPFMMEFRFRTPDGTVRIVDSRASAMHGLDGALTGYVGTVEDITARKLAERAVSEGEARLRTVVDNAEVILFAVDRKNVFTLAQGKGLTTLALSEDDLIGSPADEIYAGAPQILGYLQRAQHGEKLEATAEAFGRTFDMQFVPDVDGAGEPDGVMGIAIDITDRVAAERALRAQVDEMERLSRHLSKSQDALQDKSAELARMLETERERARRDGLTGVYNHGAINTMLEDLASEPDAHFAVAMVDVDGMKIANDTYGHQAGDLVLLRVVQALNGDDAVLGRYGGDEFLVILPGADREVATAFREAVDGDLANARVYDPETGASIPVVASVGVAVYPDDAAEVSALVELADDAMYAIKRERRQRGQRLSNTRALDDERAATVVGELVPLLTGPGSLQDKLRAVGHRLTVAGGYDAINIDVFDGPEGSLLAQNNFAKAPDELLDAWNREQRTGEPGAGGINRVVAETRRAVVIDDISADERISEPQREILAAVGILSGCVAPMFWQDTLVGVVSVGSKHKAAFDLKEARFLTTVAAQVTAIIRLAARAERFDEAGESRAA